MKALFFALIVAGLLVSCGGPAEPVPEPDTEGDNLAGLAAIDAELAELDNLDFDIDEDIENLDLSLE